MSEKYRPNPFFNGVSSFKAAFPMLADALIEWRERRGPGDASGGEMRRTGFKRGNFTSGVMPCSNPACHEGGYEIDRLVAAMIREAENEREGVLLCSGREIGDETRRGPIRCPHRIHYKAVLTPRAEGDGQPGPEKPGGRAEGENRRSGRRHFHRRNRGRSPQKNSAA
jgi:hypothetical protein